MNEKSRLRDLISQFDNRQSKIQNRKSVGLLAILLLLVGYVEMAEAQQQGKVHRIGLLMFTSPAVADPLIEGIPAGSARAWLRRGQEPRHRATVCRG
jgi:hypothetical protein